MALSSGVRGAVGMAAGWIVVAGSAAFSLLYFSEIKDTARWMLGIEAPAASKPVEVRRRPDRDVSPVRTSSRNRTVEIKAGAHGHYFATVEINGRSVNVL